ncbi:PREDICTED: formin-like protein 4 [Camelina sativa]|uniref:Formin-like protein n=1 Tax=Camelina sativa TaxID=90675 RepID=A0ABM0WXX2_CAMSA|nr:PREDICTED: formin-like protein 4 [Camelina sativa]
MAALLMQPWLPHHLTLILFSLILFFPNQSFSQSDSPQNIETFFPNDTISAPAPSPVPSPPLPPTSSSSSDRGKITRAVLITAASTLLVAAVFFFFFHKCVIARRRRRNRVGGVENTLPPPVPPLAETTLAREGFTRFGGNVKGLILDENGLDVLYWRKSQSQRNNKNGSFKKEIVHGDDNDEEKNVIHSKNKKNSEIPLLRGRSSTSQSVVHNDKYNNTTTTTHPPPHVKTESFKNAKSDPSPPPPPPPPIPVKQSAPPPPPPPKPKSGPSPPPPPPLKKTAALSSSVSKPPPAPKGSSSSGEGSNGQVKLKPLHWDKVNPDSDHSMVWDKIDRGSFSFDGDLMEALFGYVAVKKSPDDGGDKKPNSTLPTQIFILDPRKSQNTAIVLKSLGMTRDELVESLMEGHDFHPDTLERLSRIAPTKEEQSAILQFDGDMKMLADAESFLFHLLKAVPCAFTRLNALLFRANYYPEISNYNKSLQTLDLACTELRSRGLFVKLLEAILKSGNRMNQGTARGDAQAFNLTALLKLSDVKSVDGKTTLLNFVVEEVVRSEGKRCVLNRRSNRSFSRSSSSSSSISEVISKEEQEKEYLRLGLPVVGGLSAEFSNVKKAAAIDYDTVAATCLALTSRAKDARRVLAQSEGDNKEGERFVKKMNEFLDSVEEELKLARDEEKKVMELVKKTTEYYQAGAVKGKNPLHLFVIVRDFLAMVDKVCVEISRNLQRRTAMGSPQQRNAVKFPVLPPNFMSDRSKSESGGSDSDM